MQLPRRLRGAAGCAAGHGRGLCGESTKRDRPWRDHGRSIPLHQFTLQGSTVAPIEGRPFKGFDLCDLCQESTLEIDRRFGAEDGEEGLVGRGLSAGGLGPCNNVQRADAIIARCADADLLVRRSALRLQPSLWR